MGAGGRSIKVVDMIVLPCSRSGSSISPTLAEQLAGNEIK
jgi:hypothetical protein